MDISGIKVKTPMLLRNRRLLDIIVLGILIIIMVAVFIPLLFPKDETPIRVRPVTCTACKKKSNADVGNIEKCSCPLCNGDVEYTYKCVECDFEFPLRRVKTKDIVGIKNMTPRLYREYRINESRCPNCGSIFTDPKRQ